jgi:hypothetical protein
MQLYSNYKRPHERSISYKLPKSQVEAFNGAEVFLKSSIVELEKFMV